MNTLVYTLVAVAIGGYYLWLSQSLTDPVRRRRQRWLAWLIIGGSLLVLVLDLLPVQ